MADQRKIDDLDQWETNRLAFSDAQWADEAKQEGFQNKTDDELTDLHARLTTKKAKADDDQAVATKYPTYHQAQLEEAFLAGGFDATTAANLAATKGAALNRNAEYRQKKLAQGLKRIEEEQRLRSQGRVTRTPR